MLSKCFSLFNSAQVRKLHFLLFTGTGSRFFSFRLRERGLFLRELGSTVLCFLGPSFDGSFRLRMFYFISVVREMIETTSEHKRCVIRKFNEDIQTTLKKKDRVWFRREASWTGVEQTPPSSSASSLTSKLGRTFPSRNSVALARDNSYMQLAS